MRKIGQVALAGTLGLLGTAACTAQAQSTSPSPTPTVTATATASRQPIRVELNPARTTGGTTKSIRIRAFCPFPQGGTEYRATARSSAFTGVVTLAQPTATPSANGASATPATPEVRGFALLSAEARPGTYNVEVRCEGTNDTGTARLTITARPRATPTPTRTRTTIPTRAPHAGGGGTAADGPSEESGLPLPLTGLAAVAVVGAGIMLVRRRAR